MSQFCLNCNSQITCGCKRRSASDGTQVCVNCIEDYEKKLVEQKEQNAQVVEENKTNT